MHVIPERTFQTCILIVSPYEIGIDRFGRQELDGNDLPIYYPKGSSMRIIFRGQNRRGATVCGSATVNDQDGVTQFIQRRWDRGWQWLTVTDTDNPSDVLGRITSDALGQFTWWAVNTRLPIRGDQS